MAVPKRRTTLGPGPTGRGGVGSRDRDFDEAPKVLRHMREKGFDIGSAADTRGGPAYVRTPEGLLLPAAVVSKREPSTTPKDLAEGRALERQNEFYGRLMTQMREREGGLPAVPQKTPTVGKAPPMGGLQSEQQEEFRKFRALDDAAAAAGAQPVPGAGMAYAPRADAQQQYIARRQDAKDRVEHYDRTKALLGEQAAQATLPVAQGEVYPEPMSHHEVQANAEDKADRTRIALERLRAIAGGGGFEPRLPEQGKGFVVDAPDAVDRALESPEGIGRGRPKAALPMGRGREERARL